MRSFKMTGYTAFVFLAYVSSTKAQAGSFREISGGLVVEIFSPQYGEFATVTSAKTEPALPKTMLVTGGHVTFAKSGFITGGQVKFGSTKAQTLTSGSYFSTGVFGFDVGYGVSFGEVDLLFTSMLGLGKSSYSSASATKPGAVEVSYLAIAPQFLIGFPIISSFKVSAGYSYQLGYIHNISQFGPELISDPTKIKVGGTSMILQISFGQF